MRRHAMLVTCVVVLFLAGVSTNAAPIHDAAAKGDLAKCKSLLGKGPKLVSATDKDGATPLHYAVAGGHQPVVELLLTKKADVNAKKKDGVTPLHVAAALGRVEIAKVLIAKWADPAATDKQGRTPLSLAQEKGQTEVAKVLGGSTNSGHTPTRTEIDAIMQACKDGNLEIVKRMVEANPLLVNVRDDRTGDTPLFCTANKQDVQVGEWLIQHGADVNARSPEGQTPLHYAMSGPLSDYADMLLRHGADVNARANNGDMPLHLAAWHTASKVALLISKGANVNAVTNNGTTPLHCAMGGMRVHAGEAKVLLDHGANVNARITRASGKYPAGSTPLKMASMQGRQELVDLLRQYGGTE